MATLDSRTSLRCASLDGQVFPIGTGPRPPQHPNCRSTITPVTKSWRELAKPGALKRGRGADNLDALFERRLKGKGFTPDQIAGIKRATRASMTGQVPGKLTYARWLRRQPAAFQDDVLGPTRAALFRDGTLTLDRFVDDRTGRAFTLADLAIT